VAMPCDGARHSHAYDRIGVSVQEAGRPGPVHVAIDAAAHRVRNRAACGNCGS
jgi:hypothetical protein